MSSRRIVGEEKTVLDRDEPLEKSDTSPAVPRDVLIKLLAFTFAMIVIPIGSYFLTVHTIFSGNSTYAGALAAVMANVVLIGYIVVAMNEDQSDQLKAEKKDTKKDQ
ncbi:VMA21-like domain-containing protein [Sarocladium implicatum]|nr:VMA21-like domain-containing protein [Sarocladium implicatum]